MNNIEEMIKTAISQRKTIRFNYKGEGFRTGNPHCIFFHNTSGTLLVDLYQLSGYTSSKENVPGWKQFTISEISQLTMTDNNFEIANGYNPISDKYRNSVFKI